MVIGGNGVVQMFSCGHSEYIAHMEYIAHASVMSMAARRGTLQNLDSGLWTGPWTGLWTGLVTTITGFPAITEDMYSLQNP